MAQMLPPAPLQMTLLGPPELTHGGQAVAIPRRQARALLYRLAAASHPLPREQLCFLLWPDNPELSARRNLSVLLSQLRAALPHANLLLTSSETIGLDTAFIQIDTQVATRLGSHALRDRQIDALVAAARLYSGPLLDGFALPDAPEFDAWMLQERQSWERWYSEVLAALLEAHAAAGAYAAAIAVAHQGLALDELDEGLHRRLIALYAAMGDRGSAMRQFEQCVVVLERELGVGPLPETRAVYEAVRDGQHPLRLPQPTQDAAELRRLLAAEAPSVAAPAPFTAARLPMPLGVLFGREAEIVALRTQLALPSVRLVTLTGPGGSGKTRLALEVAQQLQASFADGGIFVPLAPLRDPGLVIDAIAQALGVAGAGIPSLIESVQTALAGRQVLLVLDNFEHLLPAAPLLAELLRALPQLRMLVTSRNRLHLSGEQVFPVSPLPLPPLDPLPPLAELAAQPAVALLLARTQELHPSFALSAAHAADLAAICVRLDGLPLALELAAARLRLMTPQALLRRLDHRLTLLTQGSRDLPARQRTLRDVIAWSYGLLDRTERALFERLAVFVGSWSLDAAEELGRCAEHPTLLASSSVLDALAALVDASLVQQISGTDGEPRMQLLETIREFAHERLAERGVAAAIADAHTRYYATRAAEAALHLRTADAPRWLDRLDDDRANMLAALEHAAQKGERGLVLQLLQALIPFWCFRGHLHEGRYWIERTLPTGATHTANDDAQERMLLAQVCFVANNLYFLQGDSLAARACLQASVACWRTLADPSQLAIALITLAMVSAMTGEHATAATLTAESEALVAHAGSAEANARLALHYGLGMRQSGKPRESRDQFITALAYYRQHGDLELLSIILLNLASLRLVLGDEAAAKAHATEVLALAGQLKSQTLAAHALNDLGELARYCGDDREAEAHYTESLALFQRMGNRSQLPRLLHNLAQLALRQGNVARAAALFGESLELFIEQQHARGIGEGLIGMAAVATVREAPLLAAQLWGAAAALGAGGEWDLWPPDQLAYAAALARARALSESAEFVQAWQAGRALTVPEAQALAAAVQQAAPPTQPLLLV